MNLEDARQVIRVAVCKWFASLHCVRDTRALAYSHIYPLHFTETMFCLTQRPVPKIQSRRLTLNGTFLFLVDTHFVLSKCP